MEKSGVKWNKEMVARAHEILSGIPEKVINLEVYVQQRGKSLGCGTIACGAGWLGFHPEFRALGFITTEDGDVEDIKVREPSNLSRLFVEDYAMEYSWSDPAYNYLFAARGYGDYDEDIEDFKNLSDKEVLLARLKRAYYE